MKITFEQSQTKSGYDCLTLKARYADVKIIFDNEEVFCIDLDGHEFNAGDDILHGLFVSVCKGAFPAVCEIHSLNDIANKARDQYANRPMSFQDQRDHEIEQSAGWNQ